MALNLVLLALELWGLSCLALFLHGLSRRFSLIPLIALIATLVAALRFAASVLSVYIAVAPHFNLTWAGNLLIPVILMAVLVLYIVEGTTLARTMIFTIIFINILAIVLFAIEKGHLSLDGSKSLTGLTADSELLSTNYRWLIASEVAFFIDLFVIVIGYQALVNYAPHLPAWTVPGIALVFVLCINSLVFTTLSSTSLAEVAEFLPGDLAGKLVSGLVLWPLLAIYLLRVVPLMFETTRSRKRPTLDLLFGSSHIEAALTHSEMTLQETEERFRQLTDNIDEVFWLSTPEMNHAFYVSPAFEKIWRRPARSIYEIPNTFIESVHPEDRERLSAAMHKQVLGTFDEEYRIVRPDGEVRWIRDRAFPIRDDRGKVYRVAGIAEDITQRKQAEEQRFKLALEQEKVQMLRDFISDASHDLKNPLAGINMKLSVIEATEDPDQRSQYITQLQSQVIRLANLIDNLLALSSLEHSPEMSSKLFNINQIISELSEANRPIAESKQITLTLDLNPDLPVLIGNESELARALTNLIDNALRYTPAGGKINIRTFLQDNCIRVQVSDTGVGISEADLPYIFDRFYRAKGGSKRRTGTGLGLAIVKTIVEKHQGSISVESTLGQGTTFTLALPADQGR